MKLVALEWDSLAGFRTTPINPDKDAYLKNRNIRYFMIYILYAYQTGYCRKRKEFNKISDRTYQLTDF